MVVLTADCAPVALASDAAAAVVHAGWTGALAGVVEAAVAQLRAVGHGDVVAAIGPCIRPGCYEFGADDLATITARLGPEVASTTDDGQPALDLPGAVRVALERAGVHEVTDVGICTASSPDYFSHRRDGTTGRQGLIVVLDP
jgi:copper oxidase (laccase) domain-containing protein